MKPVWKLLCSLMGGKIRLISLYMHILASEHMETDDISTFQQNLEKKQALFALSYMLNMTYHNTQQRIAYIAAALPAFHIQRLIIPQLSMNSPTGCAGSKILSRINDKKNYIRIFCSLKTASLATYYLLLRY